MPQKQRKRRKTLRKKEHEKYVKFLRKQLRRRSSVEVRSPKQGEGYLEHSSILGKQEAVAMDPWKSEDFWKNYAPAFWENYATAQEWQNRHNVAWWRTRCTAVERENTILRSQIRWLVTGTRYSSSTKEKQGQHSDEMKNDEDKETREEAVANSSEDLELNVTEEWLAFLETSARHRKEMQERRKSEGNDVNQMETPKTPKISSKKKKAMKKEPVTVNSPKTFEAFEALRKEAELLYGDASPKIRAMEAAMQVTTNRFKDLLHPQYWPNIPLKP